MQQFVFNSNSTFNGFGIKDALKKLLDNDFPVVVCIGSDLALGDSLGPLIGTKISSVLKGKCYVYGTLNSTVTAKECNTVCNNVKSLHPKSKIIAIDAAVGNVEDVGVIKVQNIGIKPGFGVGKDLKEIGDVSIIAIMGDKKDGLKNITSGIRLSQVNSISDKIASAIIDLFENK